MKRRCLVPVAIVICAVWLCANGVILAREDDPPKPSDGIEQKSPGQDEQEPVKGYPVNKRRIGTPTDVEWDLDNSFPKSGSVLELILRCLENRHP